MQLITITITFIVIFTTFYSYGSFISNKFFKNNETDIFFKILIGYCLVGLIALIIHFFFKINNTISIIIILVAIIFFIYNFSSINKKEYFILLILIPLVSLLLFAYSDHAIDANMYHHPYVSYLKTEKIIFAIANIQFRFGHISFLQYVQSVLTNDYLSKISLASINIIFFICFIFFLLNKIFQTKSLNYSFLISVLIISFLLTKYARYREYGNDLIPLLVCFYFFINIIEPEKLNPFTNKNIFNYSFPFAAFMLTHKISFVFSSLIFLPMLNWTKFKLLWRVNYIYLLIFLVVLSLWLTKNYITTSCLVYPIEITCIKNSSFALGGISEPAKAAWLTEIWAKGFIDNPNWKNMNLNEYIEGFNWTSTWLKGHFIKILEIISPLLFIILISTVYMAFKKKEYFGKKTKSKKLKIFKYLWFMIFLGLFIWFYKAPIFRYGSFYIISFVCISYVIILSYFYNLRENKNLIFFKTIVIMSLTFFIIKNGIRIYNSELKIFPKTENIEHLKKINLKNKSDLSLYSVTNGVCYYSKTICSHETPESIRVLKFGSYFVIKN